METQGRAFGLAVVLAMLAGCGATIVRSPKDGGPIYGKIVGNGETRMYVETTSGDRVGVFHTDIESIDHPGNVAAVVGGLLTLYGSTMRASDSRNATTREPPSAPASLRQQRSAFRS